MEQLSMFEYWAPNKGQSIATLVEEFATTAGQPKDVLMARKLVREEYKEWADEICDNASKPEDELKELADLIYVVYGYARAKGYDLEGAVQAVHLNNMGRMFQDDGSIKRRADGKILKNPSYPKVDLTKFTGENQ